MSGNFNSLFIYAGYELNKAYIASTLCENKAKPQMHCKGKCYLSNKIKQEEQKEKSQERTSQKERSMDAEITQKLTLTLPFCSIITTKAIDPLFILSKYSPVIFHPPWA